MQKTFLVTNRHILQSKPINRAPGDALPYVIDLNNFYMTDKSKISAKHSDRKKEFCVTLKNNLLNLAKGSYQQAFLSSL